MYYSRKLRNDFSITGFIPAMIGLTLMGLTTVVSGIRTGLIAMSLYFLLYAMFSFYIHLRVGNISYLVASLWQFLVGLYILSRPEILYSRFFGETATALINFLLLAVTVWLLYLYFSRKAKWKGREVFELASFKIESAKNGFTGRPLPSGKAEYTESQLKNFAEFLQRNLVAMAFRETGGIALVPVKMGDEFSFIFNPGKFRHTRTWIFFDFEGNVTVSISKKDYLEYREELTFDELCENLAALFIEFLEYHKKEEGGRIIWKLDDLRLGFTS